jgi:NhaP-type Na+/H+ or K+/H+ antiporter
MFSLIAKEKVIRPSICYWSSIANTHLKLFINEVILGTVFGILIGPYVVDVFSPRSWGPYTMRITLEVMRVVLGVGLFAIGVDLPQSYMAKHAKGLLVMVVPTMAIGWVIVAGR